MEQSKRLAAFVGPLLMAVPASEALNLRIWASVPPTVVYLDGVLLFAGGLALVLAHNRWRRDWTVLLTLTGWLAGLAGLYRLFAPRAPQPGDWSLTYAAIAMLFAVGAFLTFKAVRR